MRLCPIRAHPVPIFFGFDLWSAYRAAFQTVPETIRCRALEVFGDEAIVAEWLTTRIVALGGHTPIDTLMRANGEEEVFKVLGRIEHGICL